MSSFDGYDRFSLPPSLPPVSIVGRQTRKQKEGTIDQSIRKKGYEKKDMKVGTFAFGNHLITRETDFSTVEILSFDPIETTIFSIDRYKSVHPSFLSFCSFVSKREGNRRIEKRNG